MRIGIIGKGHVGTALGEGWRKAGHEVKFGHRDPKEPTGEAAHFGQVVVLAVPFSQLKITVQEMGPEADGKVVIDVTNNIGDGGQWAIGFTSSGAEELQKLLPRSSVVKAFNTTFARTMSTGSVDGEKLTIFVAGDDQNAKATVLGLAKDIGFDTIDAGPLSSSRYLEPMGLQLIRLAFEVGIGTSIGYRLVKP